MKYLIYFGSGLGDFAIIYPFLRAIREYDENAVIKLFQRNNRKRAESFHELLKISNIDLSIGYYSARNIVHSIGFLKDLGHQEYDYAFALQYTVNSHTSKWPFRIMRYASKVTLGFDNEYQNTPYDIKVKFDKTKTRLVNFYQMLEKIGIPRASKPCLFTDEIVSLKNVYTLPANDRKNIVLAVGCTDWRRSWKYENWWELAKKLANNNYRVILLGGKKEKDEWNVRDSAENIENLIGKTSLKESLSIMSQAELVIGADTGMTQLAGILDIKVIVLLGCTDYRQVLPNGNKSYYVSSTVTCSPCFSTSQERICKRAICMENILVEEVFDKVQSVIL
ncbi:glycosyltransferase family 9 protein [Selenomonas ruminantium]|uniref:glycosyltransferase family 9 protein n=1 Tax=Selenomonas ruminantium TaxID=971 RepID=UPI0026F0ED3B|nr:glycosyltransferase family 9 protein [Selenomonas ruminantium]